MTGDEMYVPGDGADADAAAPRAPDDALTRLVDMLTQEHRARALTSMNASTLAELNAHDLVAIITHDLLTPLSAMTGAAARIRESAAALDGAAEVLLWAEDLLRSTEDMRSLIGALEFGAFDEGAPRLTRNRQSLGAILHKAVDAFLPFAVAKSIVLSRDVADGVDVDGDEARLAQVMLNVVDNAIKFTSVDGLIRVRMSATEEECTVAVADTGVGIPRASLSAVFAPARHRATEDPARRPVGLYVSRLIVEAHGGRMWAESDGRSGSTIYFTLPMASSGASRAWR